MKANLRKFVGAAVFGLAMFSQSLPAWAGEKYLPEVTVGTGWAMGSMAGARFSSDTKQAIGCQFEPLYARVNCGATDKTGNVFYCTRIDANFGNVVKAISDSSFIYFSGDSQGTCTSFIIENFSRSLR
jgi:hypothetical protein